MSLEIGLYLALGVVVGIVAPAAGIGGGLFMVPAFLILFAHLGIAPGLVAHLAVGSSVAAAALISVSSVLAHARRGNVNWRTFAAMAPGLAAGAVLGGLIAHWLPDAALHRIFAGLLLALALYLFAGLEPKERHRETPPGAAVAVPAGFGIGAVATMVGIGGGSMVVPFLLMSGLSSARAAGTSSAAVLATVLAGSATYIVAGRGVGGLPPGALGYVYGPAVLGTAATAMLFAPLGARIGQALPPRLFKRLFALLLVAVAVELLV